MYLSWAEMQPSIGNTDDKLGAISSLVPNLTLQKCNLNVNNEIACSLRCLLLGQRHLRYMREK